MSAKCDENIFTFVMEVSFVIVLFLVSVRVSDNINFISIHFVMHLHYYLYNFHISLGIIVIEKFADDWRGFATKHACLVHMS